jgi:hypothetical protein
MADTKLLNISGIGSRFPSSSSAGVASFTIDSSDDKIYWLFQMPRTDTITKVGFRYNLRTGTPVAHKASLQALNAGTATPSGTSLGGGSPAEKAFTPPADATWDATGQEQTLDNSISLTQGTVYAYVIEPTGSPSGSHNSAFTHSTTNLSARQGFPCAATITNGGAPALQSTGPIFWLASATHYYGFPMLSFHTTQISTPNEQAATITLPAGFCDTKKIRGIRASLRMSAAAKTVLIQLYDNGTSPGQAITWDSDIGLTSDFRWFEIYFNDTTLDSLNAGNTVYVGFAPQEATSNFSLMGINLPSAASKDAWPGGDIFGFATRAGGAWTPVDTILPMVEFIVDDVTEPAGGGAGVAVLTGGGLAG